MAGELREQILSGERAPGSRLGQEVLAAEFGASRMPVREALRALEAEGLVTIKSHSGAWVTGLDEEEFEQVYRLREAVEPMVIIESIPRLTDDQIGEAARLADEIERTGGAGGLNAFMRLDREFHLLTYAGAGWSYLNELVTRLWNTTQPYRRELVRQMPEDSFRATCAEHALIVDALQRRDVRAGAGVVQLHIHRTRLTLLESDYAVEMWAPDASSHTSEASRADLG
ncbi:GntR family transcriptional regulator [Brooklawnia cerclae]|uniref:GntR family transcriptional regulator n=1 Tax=Brooklawnia cerclae TaxID=349934 RepID=UPI0031E0C09A